MHFVSSFYIYIYTYIYTSRYLYLPFSMSLFMPSVLSLCRHFFIYCVSSLFRCSLFTSTCLYGCVLYVFSGLVRYAVSYVCLYSLSYFGISLCMCLFISLLRYVCRPCLFIS